MKIANNIALLSICLIMSSNLSIKTATINEPITNKFTISNKPNNTIKEGKITITDEDGNILRIFDISELNQVMHLIDTHNLHLQR